MSNQQLIRASQLPTMMEGQVVPGIEGTLSRIYEWKDGTNKNGHWSFQNGEITDDQGGKVMLKFTNYDEIAQAAKGQRVRITSNQTQNGIHGVKVFDDDYNEKITRKLKITGAASFEIVGGGNQPQQQAPQQQQTNAGGYEDPPFDEPQQPTQQQEPYYPDQDQAPPQQQPQNPPPQNNPPAQPQQRKPVALPEGVQVSKLSYQETRQQYNPDGSTKYEPLVFKLDVDLQPGASIGEAWKYCQQASNACLKHSTGR